MTGNAKGSVIKAMAAGFQRETLKNVLSSKCGMKQRINCFWGAGKMGFMGARKLEQD